MREEVPAGRHSVTWLGRDRDGRKVAGGQYVGALRVSGPGVTRDLNRKITILR